MRTQAAVLWEVGRDWDVIDVELDPPKEERCWFASPQAVCATPTNMP
jgi:Zn-dependent alcohol dehydrogenase